MQSRVSRLIAPLAQRVGEDASAAQIAAAVIATWREIDAALSPIIGTRGVAALYRRSLHLTAATHRWITVQPEVLPPEMDLAGLQSMIALQSSADAAAGSTALFQAFHELLGSLVGPALTERLLRTVWADASSGSPAQDIR
ncbi:hypothetical protein HLB44_01735 [Aquincola sp. S2]|uniref:Uncharacterized protein n=1 Tax=Pseudaquabacterium terrae TaxID=2732868 RepID=A0ABX2EBH0_9BURK|nr:hypothetical protein [Aquabacterium terrae]NRF65697.1 hypothetical protein [Aquabacterium terrae]